MTLKFWTALIVSVIAATAPAQAAGGGGHGAKKEGHGGSKAKAPKKQRPITSLESWVMVDPFSVTVIQNDSIRGKVSVSFGMDVPDAELRERAELIMPRLQDAWLNRLNLYASTTVRPGKPANIDDVSQILQSTADQVLGKPGSKVLIASVIVDMR
jgi:flagellar basal body-associated protein FliL